MVHVLEALEALGEILVVELRIEVVRVLLAEALGAKDVEARALLHQRDGHKVREVLLGDVLPHRARCAPDKLKPVAHALTRPLKHYRMFSMGT